MVATLSKALSMPARSTPEAVGASLSTTSTVTKPAWGTKTVTCFVLFGPVDAKQVTAFVPQAGFVTVDVVGKDAPTASGVDLAAMDKAFDSVATIGYSRDKAKPHEALEAPVTIERFARALDNSTSTHTGSKDITVTLASDVTFASDSADLAPGAEAQLKTVAGQLASTPTADADDCGAH